MATTKSTTASGSFFKPTKTGDMVEGIFGGFEHSMNPDIAAPVMRIGDVKVGVSAGIKSLIAESQKTWKVGKTRIKVVYLSTEKVKSDKKRRVHVFAVYVDGKQLEGKAGVMSKGELTAFFNPSPAPASKK